MSRVLLHELINFKLLKNIKKIWCGDGLAIFVFARGSVFLIYNFALCSRKAFIF